MRPSRRAAHLLAHQILALSIQEQGIPRSDWWGWLSGATPFADLTDAERGVILEHMLAEGIVVDADGRLSLGARGEKLYGFKHFSELYAVFSVPQSILVYRGEEEIGSVDATFLRGLTPGTEKSSFVLGAQAWELVHVDWKAGKCAVRPAAGGAGAARWFGSPAALGYELCQAMRAILAGDDVSPVWSKRALEVIGRLREEHAFLRDGDAAPIVESADEITWWTFAGARANRLLGAMVERELGGRCVVRDLSITCKEKAAESVVAFRQLLTRFAAEARPTSDDAIRFAPADREQLSKFAPCLPKAMLVELAARHSDWRSAQAVVAAATQQRRLSYSDPA